MGNKYVNPSYSEELPRACRYVVSQHPSRLVDVRQQLDRLTLSGVIWCPYTSHRVFRPLEPISFFRGFLQYGHTIQMHLPDRVLRQYGYMQTIPASSSQQQPSSVFDYIDIFYFYFIIVNDYIIIVIV